MQATSPEQLKEAIDRMLKAISHQKQSDQLFLESLPKSFIKFLEDKSIMVSHMLIAIPRFIRLKPGYSPSQKQLSIDMGISQENIIRIDKEFFALQPDTKINNTKPYQQGQIYGMDFSSSIPIRCLDVNPGNRILQLCSAPGNKSMYLADLVPDIQITAVEINQNRAQIMKNLVKKYKLQDKITVLIEDGVKYKSLQLFDRVIIDAQCTHEGSIKHIKKFMKSFDSDSVRKQSKNQKKDKKKLTKQQQKQFLKNNSNPYTSEISQTNQWGQKDFEKRFLDPQKLVNLGELQMGLLQNGFNLLKENGIFVYSTCSFDKDQNQNLIIKFMQRISCRIEKNPDQNKFYADILDAGNGVNCNLGYQKCEELEGGIRLNPETSRTGGMFICKLRKRKINDNQADKNELN